MLVTLDFWDLLLATAKNCHQHGLGINNIPTPLTKNSFVTLIFESSCFLYFWMTSASSSLLADSSNHASKACWSHIIWFLSSSIFELFVKSLFSKRFLCSNCSSSCFRSVQIRAQRMVRVRCPSPEVTPGMSGTVQGRRPSRTESKFVRVVEKWLKI